MRGTFHFHSTFSHDGRNSLAEIASTLRNRGFSFCVMTEHFEDFDRPKFERYVKEVDDLNRQGGFVLVPGVEVNLAGIDTILFPARQYDNCVRFGDDARNGGSQLFSVLAHPSKYSFDKVAAHLAQYRITGFEAWNQQADSSYIPPLELLRSLRSHQGRHQYHYFFGCDLHDVNLAVSNFLSLSDAVPVNGQSIAAELGAGRFSAVNSYTGVTFNNGVQANGLDAWLEDVFRNPFLKGRMLRCIRRPLKSLYGVLPRWARHLTNNFKNYIRNKI